jgi:hypothetical protein
MSVRAREITFVDSMESAHATIPDILASALRFTREPTVRQAALSTSYLVA